MQDVSNIEFKYNGKVYQAVEQSSCDCEGCAFEDYNCTLVNVEAQAQTGHRCSSWYLNIIWKEKQPENTVGEDLQPESNVEKATTQPEPLTWTLDEIEAAYYRKWPGSDFVGFRCVLLEQKDPDYQKYLELKAKFGE